ncbi:sulfotransferase [Nocardioides sp. WL0053]|uniref:Sulfotransferase n=1 Tax=Nocardioides jiangsuensis TaxID=2866161 RepID=A0ABS7RK23_9ACTN|nr:sulfotransferase [Nocardioides jiangsuensis]MBY9074829.1 sulfotransferase [Nocardioides jiangsuensis]
MIGGWGRCGSTLLDMMLGQVPGLVSAGEVRELWLRGCVENRPCGCGASFRTCPFWTEVGEAAFGGWDNLDLDRVLRVRYTVDRPWGVPRLLSRRTAGDEDLAMYGDVLARLFEGIRKVSGARVVIDSSKLPSHTMMLRRTADVDVRLVHLVRDSRGVAYSNTKVVLKQVTEGEPTMLPRHGAVGASARYTLYNGLTAWTNRLDVDYMLLRYEDLIADPERNLRAILAHAGEPDDVELPFLTSEGALLAENHLVDGNPVRFSKGAVPLRSDEEWRTRMTSRDRRLVTALTLPLLATYGYPVR